MPTWLIDISVNNSGGYRVVADNEQEACNLAEQMLIHDIQAGTSTYWVHEEDDD